MITGKVNANNELNAESPSLPQTILINVLLYEKMWDDLK